MLKAVAITLALKGPGSIHTFICWFIFLLNSLSIMSCSLVSGKGRLNLYKNESQIKPKKKTKSHIPPVEPGEWYHYSVMVCVSQLSHCVILSLARSPPVHKHIGRSVFQWESYWL